MNLHFPANVVKDVQSDVSLGQPTYSPASRCARPPDRAPETMTCPTQAKQCA